MAELGNNKIDTIKEITISEIEENIDNWVVENIGINFKFREYQKETIVNIIYNILNKKNKTQIIEAPTGSGKSLLNIISAGVIADFYNRTSYILVSDLYLWKQYEDFVKQHHNIKQNFGILKGQTGNYICNINHQDMRNSDCRMAGISWASLFDRRSACNLGYECASSCKYVKERKKAIKCKVVIMTYQLYHYMINVVEKTNPGAMFSFKRRDVIFCDECHNIPHIVKNNFTPDIKYQYINQFKTLYAYCDKYCSEKSLFDDRYDDGFNINFDERLIDKYTGDITHITPINSVHSWDEIQNIFNHVWEIFVDEHANFTNELEAIETYINIFNMFQSTVNRIESVLSYKRQILKERFTEEDKTFYGACSWFKNCLCFWSDFKTSIDATDIKYVIKEIEEVRNTNTKIVKFSNVREDFLCWYFLLATSENQVMMSATIGGYDAFYENVGLKYVEEHFTSDNEEIEYTVIPSTFNFEKSPVYFLNRYKMSYYNKQISFPQLQQIIYKICDGSYKDVKGMIQTGSYANAKELYDNAPPHIKSRMLLYDGSRDKSDKIILHKMSRNTLLVGPTLVEGIDLPGNDCRLIIILKVPYPVISDKYVKEKMNLFPMWYNSTTSNIIIQGIGRGNRFTNDYCTTYILDACFLALYNATKDQYPIELQDRIKIYS